MARAARKWALVPALMLLTACGGGWMTDYDEPVGSEVSRAWDVRNVAVVVPDSLTVSNENSLAPNADIVWHGEEFGDRRFQVKQIMETGITAGTGKLNGNRPVQMNVILQEFHAVTPAAVARSPSAVHNITFTLSVIDARTGEVLAEPQLIQADLEAYVGAAAFTAAIEGRTQKARIEAHLARVIEGWLGTGPDQRRSFSSIGR